jgi:hypothetical protein
MGGLTRQPVPPATDDEIIRALTPSAARPSMRTRHFRHAGKSYIAYEGGVPGFKPGTLVATGYAVLWRTATIPRPTSWPRHSTDS